MTIGASCATHCYGVPIMRTATTLLCLTTTLALAARVSAQAPAKPLEQKQEKSDSAEAAKNALRATPIRVAIGGSFDFRRNVDVNAVDGAVRVFEPRLWGRWGIDVGMLNGRSVSRSDTVPAVTTYAGLRHLPDSTTLVRQTARRLTTGFEDRLALDCGVVHEIRESLYWTIQAEVLQRERFTTRADTLMSTDTLWTRPDTAADVFGDVPAGRVRDALVQTATKTLATTVYQSQLSVGIVIEGEFSDARLYLKPLVGIGTLDGETKALYGARFSVSDVAHGFELGGDIRGQWDTSSVSIIVYLAKDFSLQRLGEFLGGPAESP